MVSYSVFVFKHPYPNITSTTLSIIHSSSRPQTSTHPTPVNIEPSPKTTNIDASTLNIYIFIHQVDNKDDAEAGASQPDLHMPSAEHGRQGVQSCEHTNWSKSNITLHVFQPSSLDLNLSCRKWDRSLTTYFLARIFVICVGIEIGNKTLSRWINLFAVCNSLALIVVLRDHERKAQFLGFRTQSVKSTVYHQAVSYGSC